MAKRKTPSYSVCNCVYIVNHKECDHSLYKSKCVLDKFFCNVCSMNPSTALSSYLIESLIFIVLEYFIEPIEIPVFYCECTDVRLIRYLRANSKRLSYSQDYQTIKWQEIRAEYKTTFLSVTHDPTQIYYDITSIMCDHWRDCFECGIPISNNEALCYKCSLKNMFSC